jgi:CelD/BcsL family acetyltransferase involved in cellulose biosynthesis
MPTRFELRASIEPDELAMVWQELERRSTVPFFLSWYWIGCWIDEVSLKPAVLIGWVDDQVVLLGALVPATRRDPLPISIYGLHLHTTGGLVQDVITIEYNGFLIDRNWEGKIEADAIAFLLNGIEVAGHRRDELHLPNMPALFSRAVAASGCHFNEVQRKLSWRIDLEEIRTSKRLYLDCLSANTRQQIRRSIRLYERRGPLVAERARDINEALNFLEGLKELHQRYWVGRGQPGGFAYPFFESFQRRLIQTCLPHGSAEIVRVSAGSDVIGYVYNLIYRGHIYAYQTGFLYDDDARLKPGLVSHCMCINLHLGEGDKIYDFMAGDARYKASLGNAGPEMVYLIAMRSTWPLRLEDTLRVIRRRLRSALWMVVGVD